MVARPASRALSLVHFFSFLIFNLQRASCGLTPQLAARILATNLAEKLGNGVLATGSWQPGLSRARSKQKLYQYAINIAHFIFVRPSPFFFAFWACFEVQKTNWGVGVGCTLGVRKFWIFRVPPLFAVMLNQSSAASSPPPPPLPLLLASSSRGGTGS